MGGTIRWRSTPGTGSVFWFVMRIQEDRRAVTAFEPRLTGLKVHCDVGGPRLGKLLLSWLAAQGALLTSEQPDVWLTDTLRVPPASARGAPRILLSWDRGLTIGREAERLSFRPWLRQPIRRRELVEALTMIRALGAAAFLSAGRLRKQKEIVPIAATLVGLRLLLAEASAPPEIYRLCSNRLGQITN